MTVAGVLLFITLAGTKACAQMNVSVGELYAVLQLTDTVSPNDTVIVKPRFSWNENLIPSFWMEEDTLSNVSSEVQTFALSYDTLFLTQDGWRHFNYLRDGISQDTVSVYVPMQPSISNSSFTNTENSFTSYVNLHMGDTVASVTLEVCFDDTSFIGPHLDVWSTTVTSNDGFIHTEVGYLPGSPISYRWRIENHIGVSYSDTVGFYLESVITEPWNGNLSVTNETMNSADVNVQVVSFNYDCIFSYELTDNEDNSLVTNGAQIIQGTMDVEYLTFAFNGLESNHDYTFVCSTSNDAGTSAEVSINIHTLDEPIEFSLTITSVVQTSNTTATIYWTAVVPEGTGQCQLLIAEAGNEDFLPTVYESETAYFNQGIFNDYFEVSGLQSEHTYWAKLIGVANGVILNSFENPFEFYQEGNFVGILENTEQPSIWFSNGIIYNDNQTDQIIKVFSASGAVVYSGVIPAKSQIDLSFLHSGIYILECGGKIKKIMHTQ